MKTYIITGASKGIGLETTLQLIAKGHQVLAIARSSNLLLQLKNRANSERLHTLSADLTKSNDLIKIEQYCQNFNGIDGLVNNAGKVINKPFLETTEQEWKSIFDINVFASISLIKILKSHFNKKSHIVNISSMGGFQGSAKFPGLCAYSTAKGALAILSESLNEEFAQFGISVNCLCLGAVQTEMLEKAFPGYEAPVSATEMGDFISDFLQNAHKYISGKVLPIALNNPE